MPMKRLGVEIIDSTFFSLSYTSVSGNQMTKHQPGMALIPFTSTVKFGYNDYGYNEFTPKNEQEMLPFSALYYINVHGYNELTVIANKYGWFRDVCYNRVRL
jgi:hypothetical protein